MSPLSVSDMEICRPAAAVMFEPGSPDLVPQLVAAWLLAQRSDNTRDAYRRDIRMWLDWLAQWDTSPLEVRRSHADAWARWMESVPHGRRKRVASKATVNRRLAAVSSFYEYCVDEEALEVNRAGKSARHRINKRQPRAFRPSAEETVRILRAAQDAGTLPYALLVLLTFSGARVSEVLGVEIEDLGTDAGRRMMRVVRKGGEVAQVWFRPAELVGGAVDAQLAARARLARVRVTDLSGPLFLDRSGQQLTRQAAANLVGRIGRRVGCPLLTPHSMRHAFANVSLTAGAEKADIQEAMGHASIATTEGYLASTATFERHPGQLVADYLAGLDVP